MSAVYNRFNIGWYTWLVCFPLSWFYLRQSVLIEQPYREGVTALLSAGNFLPLMVAAVAAAWEGGRLSNSSVAIPSSTRHPLTIATLSILPTCVVVTLSHLVAMGIVLASNDLGPPLPHFGLYAGLVALVIGISIFSWFVGYFLTNVIAAPLMAVVIYGLAITPTLIKRPEFYSLSADRSGCCGLEQQVDRFAVATPYVIATGCILASVAMAAWLWNRGGWYPLLGLLGIVALIAGVALPGRMEDAWAVSSRDADQLICERSATTSIEYCVWPEQRADAGLFLEVGDMALRTWSNQQLIVLPRRASTQAPMAVNEGQVTASFPPDPSKGQIALSLAIGSLPDPSVCSGPAPQGVDPFQLMIWLSINAGVPPDDRVFDQFRDPSSSGPVDRVLAITRRPIADQLAWFARNKELLAACQTGPAG